MQAPQALASPGEGSEHGSDTDGPVQTRETELVSDMENSGGELPA